MVAGCFHSPFLGTPVKSQIYYLHNIGKWTTLHTKTNAISSKPDPSRERVKGSDDHTYSFLLQHATNEFVIVFVSLEVATTSLP